MAIKEIGQVKTKEDIIEILNTNNIAYNITNCGGCERICISVEDNTTCCCNSAITVQTCNKNNVCMVYPHEILFIAIENRKSVLYLTDKKIETHYTIDYWKEKLNENVFVQPHYSYIVNLNYVAELTKDFVKIKYEDKKYSVYTSLRKIGAFKKAFLNFKREDTCQMHQK